MRQGSRFPADQVGVQTDEADCQRVRVISQVPGLAFQPSQRNLVFDQQFGIAKQDMLSFHVSLDAVAGDRLEVGDLGQRYGACLRTLYNGRCQGMLGATLDFRRES